MQRKPQVALVTGGATGIGRAVALACARRGLTVAVNYSRSRQDAEQTLAEVRHLGVCAELYACNIADDAAVRKMVAQCREDLGGLDVLVNNAATTHFISHTDLEALTDDVWDEILGVNLKGTFYCCRAALPLLRERNGCIVNITSVAGLQGTGSSIPCAASKAAVNCMTKSLARAFGPHVARERRRPGAGGHALAGRAAGDAGQLCEAVAAGAGLQTRGCGRCRRVFGVWRVHGDGTGGCGRRGADSLTG